MPPFVSFVIAAMLAASAAGAVRTVLVATGARALFGWDAPIRYIGTFESMKITQDRGRRRSRAT